MHQNNPVLATQAFEILSSLSYGSELASLAQALDSFQDATDLNTIACKTPIPIADSPWLRPASWDAIACLNRTVEDAQLVQRSSSDEIRSLALDRALSELKYILSQPETLPQAERALILKIARTWQEALLQVSSVN